MIADIADAAIGRDRITHEVEDRLRQQHLAPVRDGAQGRRATHLGTVVSAAPDLNLARVQGHANPQRETIAPVLRA